MRTVMAAAAMALVAGGACAATVEAGLTWTADDGSLSLFAALEDGPAGLAGAFSSMLGSQLPATVGVDSVEAVVYQFAFSETLFPEPGPANGCLLNFNLSTLGSLSYATGVLHLLHEALITEARGSRCAIAPIYWYREDLVPGTWAVVDEEPVSPAPVPLPASGATLAFGVVGLAAAHRRKR